MSSIGAGYDTYTSQFSPDGRIFQVEYAIKAVEKSGTAIGMRGRDGVVFAVENLVTSKLYEPGGNKRTFTIDNHIGAVVAGFQADARHIVEAAQAEASNYRAQFHDAAPLMFIKQNLSGYVHTYTQFSGTRPFGASVILGSYEHHGANLFCVEPSGISFGYFGCAIGKARQEAKTEMENIDIKSKSITELVKEAARVIYAIHDGDKDFELELSWIGRITNSRHVRVPSKVHEYAEDYAKSKVNGSDSGSEN